MSEKSSRQSTFFQLDAHTDEGLKNPHCYRATTDSIVVNVRTFWLEEHCDPEEQRYVWLYHVTIENKRSESIQVLSRNWETIDANGQTENTQGLGILGEQPFIAAHGQYEYTSGLEMKTSTGFLKGFYHMLSSNNQQHFDIAIPTCSLDSPHHGGLIH